MASTNDDELQTPKLQQIADIIKTLWNGLNSNSDGDREEQKKQLDMEREEQKKQFDMEREELIESAKEMIKQVGSSSNQACANVVNVAECLSNVNHGFDWVKFDEETVLVDKANMAGHLYRNPNLTIALDNASEFFEKAESECLNKANKSFNFKEKKAQNIDEFANLVVSGLTTLTCPEFQIILNSNNLKLAFAGCIKACIDKHQKKNKYDAKFSQPIILDNGKVGWVKYKFQVDQLINSFLFKNKQSVQVDVSIRYFVFRDQHDFRMSLRDAEKKLEKNQATIDSAERIGRGTLS